MYLILCSDSPAIQIHFSLYYHLHKLQIKSLKKLKKKKKKIKLFPSEDKVKFKKNYLVV